LGETIGERWGEAGGYTQKENNKRRADGDSRRTTEGETQNWEETKGETER
jgi:hypothetical protein